MFVLYLAALAQSAPADTHHSPMHLEGRCDYPAALGEPEAGELRILCHSVTMAGDTILFERRGRGPVISFNGEWDGDRMVVRVVDPEVGGTIAARGECSVYRKNEAISAVACIARQGARTWVANFLVAGA